MDIIEKVQFLMKRFNPLFLQVGSRGIDQEKVMLLSPSGQLRNFVLWDANEIGLNKGTGLCINSQCLHGDFCDSPMGGSGRGRGNLNFHGQLGSLFASAELFFFILYLVAIHASQSWCWYQEGTWLSLLDCPSTRSNINADIKSHKVGLLLMICGLHRWEGPSLYCYSKQHEVIY